MRHKCLKFTLRWNRKKDYLNHIVMNSEFLKRLTDIVNANLADENFGVEDLVREMGLSHINLHRKLKTISNQTISQFIREIRLKMARELLLNEDLTVSEIAYRVGFGSPTYFNKCFHEYFGYPPGELNKRSLNKIEGNNENTIAEPINKKQEAVPAITKRLLKRLFLFIASGILILIAISYIIIKLFNGNPALTSVKHLKDREKSIVMLPFKNLSSNADNQYFADGVTENILNHLFRIKGIRVVSRTTAEHFQGKSLTIPEIAKKLNVNYALEGSVSRFESKVEIFVQLIEARNDKYLFSEKFERDMTDIFGVQSDIAKKVAIELETALSPNETAIIEKIPTTNAQAYDAYLLGRFFLKKRTKEDLKRSMEYFEKSILEDPNFALAFSGLADAYWLRFWWGWGPGQPKEDYEKSKKIAQQALQLDKNLCEAHTVLGNILSWGEWKWEEARKEFKLAIAFNPNYGDAHFSYAWFLDLIAENEEAREEMNLALGLDPYYAYYNGISGVLYYKQSNLKEAVSEYIKALELDPGPSYIHNDLFKIYFKRGEDLKAVEALEMFMLIDTKTAKNAHLIQKVYAESGLHGLMNFAIKSELTKSPCDMYFLATLYSLLNKKNEALDCLEKIMRERTLGYTGLVNYSTNQIPVIANDDDFINLQEEPRFLALIKKMGLYDYYFLTRKENPLKR